VPTFLIPREEAANGDGRRFTWSPETQLTVHAMHELYEDKPDERYGHTRKRPLIQVGAGSAAAYFEDIGAHVSFAYAKEQAAYFGPIARHVARSLRVTRVE
jgi:hypothetical protein